MNGNASAQIDQKGLFDIIRILPAIIQAVTKSGQPQPTNEKGLFDVLQLLPQLLPAIIGAATKSGQPIDEKGLFDILRILPVIIDAATKGFGGSVNFGTSTPFGGISGGAGFQFKDTQPQADEKFLQFLIPLLTAVVPEVIRAATKGPTAPHSSQQPDEKFLHILIPLLTAVAPEIIRAATKGPGGAMVQQSQGDEKFLQFLIPILTAVVPEVIRAATKGQAA